MDVKELSFESTKVSGLRNINVLLGRNGSGKSRLLRAIDQKLSRKDEFNLRYISPERAGVFQPDGAIMNQMDRDPTWLPEVRRRNQADNFKAVSANLLKEIEIAYLRKLQDTQSIRTDLSRNFLNDRLDKINALLTNVSIAQGKSEFFFQDTTGKKVPAEEISSGESEAVSLAAEIMYFFDTAQESKFNLLLLDEPDVHLHPDLQNRFAKYLISLIEELNPKLKPKVAVLIATHSTPLVCGFSSYESTTIGSKHFGIDVVQLSPFSTNLRKVAPFFGHPLSLTLSQDVILILEGEDDERVWQQAVRSSKGRIKVFPILATTVDQQTELERFCGPLLNSLYDNPIAYSIRDGDGVKEGLEPIGPVVRFRLQCYSIENALLTEECLSILGVTWEELKSKLTDWMKLNPSHKDCDLVAALISSSDRLRHRKIKTIRELICSMSDKRKPWEVVVGQAIGSLDIKNLSTDPNNLATFIGVETIKTLLGAGDNSSVTRP